MILLDQTQDIEAVEFAALKPDVQQHQTGLALFDAGQRRGAVAGFAGLESLVLQNPRRQGSDIGLVVDDENVMSHGRRYPIPYSRCPALRSRRPSGRRPNRQRD